jgi:acyl-CoA synthetase (AMP-forming)/AMP-acid ligase II
MPGYYKQPDLTAQAIRDGWLFSGDLGRIDQDGYLFLVDRKKDLIISGGVNVYPKDIEELVVTHPQVRDVSVFGVPHPTWGEQPIAAVRVTNNADSVEIREWVNERVSARYQKLGDVVILDEFPLSVSGKTLRRIIRSDYLEERS